MQDNVCQENFKGQDENSSVELARAQVSGCYFSETSGSRQIFPETGFFCFV